LSQEPTTEEEIVEFERRLLDLVPKAEPIGNVTLLGDLGWPESTYWRIRDRLIDAGRLIKGRGRGGSVRRVVVAAPERQAPAASSAPRTSEIELYEPILATLKSHWVKDNRIRDFVAEITAHQGRRETGGKWSRPDITLASYNTYPFVPGKHFDVYTFEVKTYDQLDVTAVYEALAHQRAAHYSYVFIAVPDDRFEAIEATLDAVRTEADEHGVGLVAMSNPSDYDTWEFLVDPVRADPDPADLNDFLAAQTTTGFKDQIVHWCR
jgi:hypothetical protein